MTTTVTPPAVEPRPASARRRHANPWPFLALVGVLGALVLPPLVVMVWKSLVPGAVNLDGALGSGAYREVVSSDDFLTTLRYTTVFVVLSTVLAMATAAAMAWLVVRTDTRGKWLAYLGLFLGIATPGVVSSIAWLLMLGGDAGFLNRGLADHGLPTFDVATLTGMVVVEAVRLTPMAFLFVVGPLSSVSTSLEEVGLMSGASRWVVLRRITVPLMRPSLVGASLLCLVWAIQAFEVPLILGSSAGVPIFTAELYSSLRNSLFPDYAIAAAYGVFMVVVLALLIALENRVLRHARRYQVVGGKERSSAPRSLGRWRLAGTGLFALFALANLAPVLYMLSASFAPRIGAPVDLGALTLDNYAALLDYRGFGNAVRNTLVVATGTAVLAVTIAFFVARYVTRRAGTVGGRIVEQLASTPLVVPTVVLSLGMLLVFLYTPFGLYGTLAGVLIAYVAHYIPYGLRYLKPALMSISSELEEAARSSGASELQVARRIVVPMTRTAILGVGTYVFSLAFRELSMAVLLVTGATPMLSTMLLGALGSGELNVVAAMGTVVMLISLAIGAIAYRALGTMGSDGPGRRSR